MSTGYFPGDAMSIGMFSGVPVIITLIFVAVIATFIVAFVRGAKQWNDNNHAPLLTVDASVVAKRVDVHQTTHHHGEDMTMHHSSSSTTYYATFQVESGDRMEFHIPDREYGMLVEGDCGKLSFQGTRYKGFVRA